MFNLNDMVTSSGLADVTSFMQGMSANSEVGKTLLSASVAFQISIYLIMFLGALAMAIWIARIGADVLLIATRGMEFGGSGLDQSFIGKMGTGKGESYASVASYLKGNLLEIVLVIILISFLMTGWLFTLISMALTGFGMLANKVMGLDVDGGLSKMSAKGFVENVSVLRPAEAKAMYDEQLGNLKTQADVMYTLASDGVEKESDKWVKASRIYTAYWSKADILGQRGQASLTTLKLNKSYFDQHKSNNDICNAGFANDVVNGYYINSGSSKGSFKATKLSCTSKVTDN